MKPKPFSVEVQVSLTVTVEGDFHPADPGRIDGPPEKCYPPEDAVVSIQRVFLGSMNITNTEWDEEELQEAVKDYFELHGEI